MFLLGVVPAPRGGLSLEFLAGFGGLLAALTAVDQAAARWAKRRWLVALALLAELALCNALVGLHGTLVRPSFAYLVPASRALLLFNGWPGLVASLLVWPAYCVAIAQQLPPDRLHEFPNYLSFFFGLYMPTVVLTLASVRSARERARLQALYTDLQQAHRELQRLHLQAAEHAVAQERNRMAREIHDTLAHHLTVMALQLEAAEKLAPSDPAAAQAQVQRARRLVAASLQDVRHSVAALRAASLHDLALSAALKRLAQEFSDATGLRVEVAALEPDPPLSPEAALALYRVAQEGLTNVHKHAGARGVTLSLRRTPSAIELSVIDDGVAVTPPSGDGFGLIGLRERLELLGGTLAFAAQPGGGSKLHASVPAAPAPA